MLNYQEGPFGYEPLPGANAQERQQAARELWRLEEKQARQEEERARQQAEWSHQEDEQRRARRLEPIAPRDLEADRTPTAASSLFEYLRHHWVAWQQNAQGRRRRGR